ncbi:MAG: metal-dependent hydrolase [Planktomarina sp.]
MKITFLGHASFRIEIGDQILLLDPWLTGNPVLGEDQHDAATDGATHILLTHGHFDHSVDVLALSQKTGAPIVGMYDLVGYWEASQDAKVIGFNKGGTVQLGDVSVTMVTAMHSSSIGTDHGPMYAGAEAGFIIRGEGQVIYASGDTDVMADMEVIADRYKPTIGILSAGGHFTMDMEGTAYACRRYFNFHTVIPCHYKTFPFLEQSAQVLIDAMPEIGVIEPEVMVAIEV